MAVAPLALGTTLYVLWLLLGALGLALLIACEEYIFPHIFLLRFPRDPEELQRYHGTWLVRVLVERGTLPAGASFASMRRCGELTAEPDKNKTAAGFELRWSAAADAAMSGGGGGSGQGGGSLNVFLKWNCGRGFPVWLQGLRAAAELNVMREVDFYRLMKPGDSNGDNEIDSAGLAAVPLRTPRCEHADKISWLNRVVIVLQYFDVREDARGVASTDSVEDTVTAVTARGSNCGIGSTPVVVYQRPDWQGCSVAGASAVLRGVAALHARYWGGRAVACASARWIPARGGLQLYNFVYDFVAKEAPWYGELWQALNAHFAATPEGVTVVHGDCRMGNMLFNAPLAQSDGGSNGRSKSDSIGVIFTDWEAVNAAPFLWDLTYLTTLSLTPTVRAAHQDALLLCYLEALRAQLQLEGRAVVGGDAALELGACRVKVMLLTLVLEYISHLISTAGAWDGHGNTARDTEAWQVRITAAVTAVDALQAAAALGVSAELVRKLQQRSAQRANL